MKRILLIGCSKTKVQTGLRNDWLPAKELYAGDLFTKRKKLAEMAAEKGAKWFILSAKNGLVRPEAQCRTYNQSLKEKTETEKVEWALGVARDLVETLDPVVPTQKHQIEIHAGDDYYRHLENIFLAVGFKVVVPMRGLGIGEQKALYIKMTESKEGAKCQQSH